MSRAGPLPIPEAELAYRIAAQITLLRVSDGIQGLLGYAAADLLSGAVSLADRIHADDGDLAELLFSPGESGAEQAANLRLRGADDGIRCVRAVYRKRPADDGDGILLELRLRDARSLARTLGDPTAVSNFRAMMENTDDFIFFKDRNHVFTGASQTLVALSDSARHWTDLIGLTDYDVFPEAYADRYYRLEKQVFAGMPVARELQEYLTKDGKQGWVDNRKYPIRDEEGEIVGLYGIARDVTERRQTEQALRESESRFRDLYEQAPLAYQSLDAEGKILEVNQAWLTQFGYRREEVIGRFIGEFITERSLPTLSCELPRFQATGRVDGATFEMVRKDASIRLMEINGRIGRDPEGNFLRTHCILTDVTARKQAEAELVRREHYQRALLDNFPFLVWLKDTESRFLAVNQALATTLGHASADALVGKTDFDVAPPDLAERYRADDREVLCSGKPKSVEELHDQCGRKVWIETYKSPVVVDGEVIGTVGFARDITVRMQTEATLRQAASVFEHAREGIMITLPDGEIVDVNQAFTRITGYGRDEALGRNPSLLKSDRHGGEFYAALWGSLVNKGYWYGEIWNRRKNGELYAEMQTISAIRDEQGRTLRYVSLFSDITPLKEQQRQLEHIAHYDALTALPNRVLLADRLRQAMAQAQRRDAKLAVAYLDLDGFKAVNDAHGHEIGDRLLTLLAARMKHSLRDGDTLARLGGDEFVAVLTDLHDSDSCVPVLERLLAAAAERVLLDDLELRVSGSLGVTFYPQAEEVDADQLLRQADQAMYQAKQAGKRRYHLFDADHDRSMRGHHESLGRIRRALAEEEFALHYQPMVNMRNRRIIGVEALIRWQHPEQGLLSPAKFLPVIENHPLAVTVGEWVLEAALNQAEAWRRAGLALPVSVNIDAMHIQRPDFVDRLRQRLARHPGFRAGDLELEVLETSALEDITQVSSVILACRELGIGFALDDFGTGYSSLTYLKRLPANTVKIDQSFVRDMLDDPNDLAILESLIGLAKAFGRGVIAEGVETSAHGEMLLRMGCELGQGYAIARPMPAVALPGWIAQWRGIVNPMPPTCGRERRSTP